MCGIAGFKLNKNVDESVIRNMVASLEHRGPDGEGYYSSGSYRGGMRRLSINDVQSGDQPLFNQDKSIALLYNGEIYNSPELRADLIKRGFSFRTNSDGEVICHLYELYGEGLFEKLDGMFAISLWSEKEQKLILARDIPGEKPLYYSTLSDNEIVFASELKSLIKFPGLNLKYDYQSIWDFPTLLWIAEPATIYENIKSLPPSHYLTVEKDGITVVAYENNFGASHNFEKIDDLVSYTREVVEESVKSRLLSDVPLGSFLSGGLDSSIVTSIAAKHLDNLSTFTIGFENLSDPYHGTADESLNAKRYASELGTRHHSLRVTADSFYDRLEKFCTYGDQPFAVSSGLGIMVIAECAQEHGIKVLLSGDGADECFGGYSWYEYLNKVGPYNSDRGEVKAGVSFQNFGLPLKARLKEFERYSSQQRAWAWHYYASEQEKALLFSDDMGHSVTSTLSQFHSYKKNDHWMPEDYIRQDLLFYFPNEMLRKVDRMTMASSVEGRVPFAAPAILNLAKNIKYTEMVKDSQLKWVLRKAFEDILPVEIVNRPKHGFNVPIDHWLKDQWSSLFNHTFSSESKLSKLGFIDSRSSEVANKMLHDKERLNGHTLFCYIMLDKWLEANSI